MIPILIQVVSLVAALFVLFVVGRLIVRGKLREEYVIIWVICTCILIVFSIWRSGLAFISHALGVYYPPSLAFLGAIFAILIFLIHLSVVISRLQNQIKTLSQEIAFLKQKEQAQEPISANKFDLVQSEKSHLK